MALQDSFDAMQQHIKGGENDIERQVEAWEEHAREAYRQDLSAARQKLEQIRNYSGES